MEIETGLLRNQPSYTQGKQEVLLPIRIWAAKQLEDANRRRETTSITEQQNCILYGKQLVLSELIAILSGL